VNRIVSSILSLLLASVVVGGCSSRSDVWNAGISNPPKAFGLSQSLALLDPNAERVLFLSVPNDDLQLNSRSLPLGKNLADAQISNDFHHLYALTRGVVPRRRADDQPARLVRYSDNGGNAFLSASYDLPDSLSGLKLDDLGKYAVVYAAANDLTFVRNPNEIVVVDLEQPASESNPKPITIRSFGGSLRGMELTPSLAMPDGQHRLLVVRSDRDVSLLDLEDLSKPDITIRLTGSDQILSPEEVIASDGEANSNLDARLAMRLANDSNIIMVDFVPQTAGSSSPHAFRPVPNIVYVGGTPGDIEFVRTDGGLRLAAAVPTQNSLALVDPITGVTSNIDVKGPFSKISLVPDVDGQATQTDVAVLWSEGAAQLAFVSLGTTSGKPYKSVEILQLESPTKAVHTIPQYPHLKLIESNSGSRFVIVNLLTRTASPLLSSKSGAQLVLAPDGSETWVFQPASYSLAKVSLADYHPQNVELNSSIWGVFDIQRSDGGRALVALHRSGSMGATVLDAHNPSLLHAREFGALLLGDLQ
jgi:hypothetical protein